MPDTKKNVSDLVNTPYTQPESALGIHLTQLAEWDVPGVLIHECGMQRHIKNWYFKNVLSPFWRLYYNSNSGNYVLWKKKRFELTPHHILLVPDDCLFDCCGPARPHHLWIHFSLTPSNAHKSEKPIEIPVNTLLSSLLRELHSSCQNCHSLNKQRALAHQATALLNICLAQCLPTLQKPLPIRLQNILKLIQNSSPLKHTNNSLAHQAGMGVETFRRWFKHHMGCTATMYVRQNRIHQACRDLAFTDISIEEIAEKNGFPNRHYFTRVFTKIMRKSPAAFRKERQ